MPPSGGGGGQQQGQSDDSMGFLWILVALFIFGFLAWYFGHEYIVAFIFKIKLLEITLISLFTSSVDSVKQTIAITPAASVTISQLGQISTMVGEYFRIPFVIILALFAILLYKNSVSNNYRKSHNMLSLHKQEQENWPQVSVVTKLNLVDQHVDEGKWAMAVSPMQFAKQHELIKEEEQPIEQGELRKSKKILAVVIESKANAIFIRQLGAPWVSPKRLKRHARALFAIFAAKAAGDRDSAEQLLRQIAASSSSKRPNFLGAEQLLKKHLQSKLVKQATTKHAFELTVMASMLEGARDDGVLASAEFLWLKPLDRVLWFMLNAVGRQTAPVEVAGPFAHWLAEKTIGRKMVIPMVGEATVGLQAALSEIIYKPDEKAVN